MQQNPSARPKVDFLPWAADRNLRPQLKTFGMKKRKKIYVYFSSVRGKEMEILDDPAAFHGITKSFESRGFSIFDLLGVMVMMGSVFHFRM